MLRVFAVHEPNSPVSVRPGLVYWCYEGQFTLARDLSTLTPIQSGHLADLDQSLPVPGDHAVLVEGYLDVPASGVYTFFLDGAISRLYLAGQPVVEADFLMATWTNWGQIGLHKGKHAFSLSCDAGALQRLKVEWDGPGLPVQAIPVSKLYC
jgi:hypothetical protein